jgi:hypothetical protein
MARQRHKINNSGMIINPEDTDNTPPPAPAIPELAALETLASSDTTAQDEEVRQVKARLFPLVNEAAQAIEQATQPYRQRTEWLYRVWNMNWAAVSSRVAASTGRGIMNLHRLMALATQCYELPGVLESQISDIRKEVQRLES